LSACNAPPASQPAPSDPAPAPVAAAPSSPQLTTSYNQLMVAWIDNASHVLWDAEKPGFAPKNDADWLEIEDHAVQVAAAATLIQLPGTGVSDAIWVKADEWQKNARLMSEAATAALAAAKSRSLPALVEANGTLVRSCEDCHKQYKPELPTEGIAHQRPHSDSHKSN
jgi:cytochrome c556